jgi:hypothetical protein
MKRFLRWRSPRLALLAAFVASGLATGGRTAAQDSATAAENRARRLASIRAELASDDARQIAAALYLSINLEMKEIAADLPALLGRVASMRPFDAQAKAFSAGSEAWKTAAALALDAAVQFGAKLSDEELDGDPLRSSIFEDAMLIVAARNPAACTKTLFSLVHDLPDDVVEFAACEVLAATAPDRLLDHLLRHLRIEVEVAVHDGEPAPPAARHAGHGVGCSFAFPDDTLPPFPRYFIRFDRGEEKFFDGPRPLYFNRDQAVGMSSACHYFGRTADDNVALLDLLTRLAGTGPWELGIVPTDELIVRVPVRWRDATSCEAQARGGIDKAVSGWNAWIARTRKLGHLPPAPEPPPPSPLVLRVVDQRADRSVALPTLTLQKRE